MITKIIRLSEERGIAARRADCAKLSKWLVSKRTDDDGWEMDSAYRNVKNDLNFTSHMLNASSLRCMSVGAHAFLYSVCILFCCDIHLIHTLNALSPEEHMSCMYLIPTLTTALIYAREALSLSSPLSCTSLNKEAKLGEDIHSNSKVTMDESFLHY